jgi:hypothetical protein
MAHFKLETENPIPRISVEASERVTKVNEQQKEAARIREAIDLRIGAYGPIGHQLDKLWHDIDDGRIMADTETSNTWYAHVKSAKANFIIPEETLSVGVNPFVDANTS